MSIRSRIFDLVFPDRRRERGEEEKPVSRRAKRRKGPAKDAEGYDPRYFIRHQR